jgi:hypothetical protein
MLVNLRALFGVFVDIILLRRGPEQLPASPALLAIVIAIYAALTAIAVSSLSIPTPDWQGKLFVGTLLALVWYQAAFVLARKRERFTQTMTATFAASALFTPALVPLASALFAQQAAKPETVSAPLAGLTFIVSVWLFVIQVRIVRAAFEWPIPVAIGFIIAQQIIAMVVLYMLFGVPEKAP